MNQRAIDIEQHCAEMGSAITPTYPPRGGKPGGSVRLDVQAGLRPGRVLEESGPLAVSSREMSCQTRARSSGPAMLARGREVPRGR